MESVCDKKNMLILEDIFRDFFLDDKIQISDKTSPEDIEDWDSLAHVNLLAIIENKFQVKFTIEELVELDSVGKILLCIQQHKVD